MKTIGGVLGALLVWGGFWLAHGTAARDFICSLMLNLPFCASPPPPPPPPPPLHACDLPAFAQYCGKFRTRAVQATFEDAFASFLDDTGQMPCQGATETAWLFDGELQIGVKKTRLSDCPEFFSRPLPTSNSKVDYYPFIRRGEQISMRSAHEPPILPGEEVEYIDLACFNEYEYPLNFARMPADALQNPQSRFRGEVIVNTADLATSVVGANLVAFAMSHRGRQVSIQPTGAIQLFHSETSRFVAIVRELDSAWPEGDQGTSARCSPANLRAAFVRLATPAHEPGLVALSLPNGPADHEIMVLLLRHQPRDEGAVSH